MFEQLYKGSGFTIKELTENIWLTDLDLAISITERQYLISIKKPIISPKLSAYFKELWIDLKGDTQKIKK
jgi:hypothetical protein